jgi:ketosteroid isomerase-like protein
MTEANWNTLRAYGDLFASLSAKTLGKLDDLVHEDIVFRDPFHEVKGREAMKRILARMFTEFDKPRFKVADLAMGDDHGFIQWRFESGSTSKSGVSFDGMSAVSFCPDSSILLHQDYWDAAASIHARLPLVGPVVRLINRTIARRTR